MAVSPDPPAADLERVVEVLNRHGVEYLLVGGGAARLYGAERPTQDTDCLPRTTAENLERLAEAMRELHARLRVEGMSDDEAAALPVVIDAAMLSGLQISTWTTDAGWLDILNDMPGADGKRRTYDDLAASVVRITMGALVAPLAPIEAIIASKQWADRPKDREALPELRRLADRPMTRPGQES